MSNTCHITEDERGYTLHTHDGTAPIDGQATYADAARLARRNGYTVVGWDKARGPDLTTVHLVHIQVGGKITELRRFVGTVDEVIHQLRCYCSNNGIH